MVKRMSKRLRSIKCNKKRVKKRKRSKRKKLNETPRPLGDYKEHLLDLLDEQQWKHYHKYGGSDEIEPCKRLKKWKTYNNRIPDYNGGENIEAYQASFIVYKGIIPSKYQKISHFCANPKNTKQTLCIEVSHMDIEPTATNNGRKTCHCLIRKYEVSERWRGNTPDGPIYASDVPISFYNDLLEKKGIRRSKRLIKTTGNYTCPHGPNHCFINYTKHQDHNSLLFVQ